MKKERNTKAKRLGETDNITKMKTNQKAAIELAPNHIKKISSSLAS